jgi:radical SAM protein with 4Fe4S-binding SPASM domain
VKEMAYEFKTDKLKSRINSIFSGPLKSLQNRSKKDCYCISPGSYYIGVSAEGDLFPCHRLVGYKDTKLGNVWDGYDRDKWLEKFAKVNVFNSKRCSTCWIKHFCGGMCPATNYLLGGDLVLSETVNSEPVHCTMKKIVFEEAVLLYCDIAKI